MKLLKNIFSVLALISVLGSVLHSTSHAQDVSCNIVDTAFDQAQSIRQLKKLRNVKCLVKQRADIEKYLLDAIKKEVPEDKLYGEEAFYKLVGFINQDFDYLQGLIDIYTSQIGGFYEPKQEYYALAGWIPALAQLPVAVHELTHALQDQHFVLDNFLDLKRYSTDEVMAHSALVEGDATLVMLDHSAILSGGQKLSEASSSSVSPFIMQQVIASAFSSGMSGAPQTIQSLLVFPYLSGLNFAKEYVHKNGGYKGLNKTYKNPPSSTEEILHIEKYEEFLKSGKKDYQKLEPLKPHPDWGLSSDSPYFTDTYGEFFISLLLGSFYDKVSAAKASSGWGGDTVAIYKNNSQYSLAWSTSWDSINDAKEFYSTFFFAMSKRFGEDKAEMTKMVNFTKISRKLGLEIKCELKTKQNLVNIYIRKIS